MLDPEMRKEVIESASDKLVDAIMKDWSARKDITNAATEKITKQLSDTYLEKNELEILKALDVDTVARLATIKLIGKVIGRMND